MPFFFRTTPCSATKYYVVLIDGKVGPAVIDLAGIGSGELERNRKSVRMQYCFEPPSLETTQAELLPLKLHPERTQRGE